MTMDSDNCTIADLVLDRLDHRTELYRRSVSYGIGNIDRRSTCVNNSENEFDQIVCSSVRVASMAENSMSSARLLASLTMATDTFERLLHG